jgi:hypothetical protein
MSVDNEDQNESEQTAKVHLLVRMLAETAFAAHLVVAAIYWWLSPQGFSVDHSRFWLKSVVPLATMAVAVAGLVGMLRPHYPTTVIAALSFASAWIGGALAGRIIFPVSLRGFWIVGLAVGLIAWGLTLVALPWDFKTLRRSCVLLTMATLVGVFVVWAQLPPLPSTDAYISPDDKLKQFLLSPSDSSVEAIVEIGDHFTIMPPSGEITLRRDKVRLTVSPFLEFDRTSPDRCWSILAPSASTARRQCRGFSSTPNSSQMWRYSDDAKFYLHGGQSSDAVEFSCYTRVERDTYSHLNSFTVLEVVGHEQLSLIFSPCPETNIDVLPADYPTGRPARFAYLDGTGKFLVVEASSGEKGPFHPLESGPLTPGDEFSISLFDRETFVATVTLDDWPTQASTAISPTAGWGVPVNAIEFQRHGDKESSPVTIWITLASTGVGRGWEVVGHQEGTYRNQIKVTTNNKEE